MQKEEEEEVDSLVCPSFSAYASDKLADITDQVTRDHLQNDNRFGSNDDNDFEFVAFQKAADASPVFPIFNRDLVTGSTADERRLLISDVDRRRESSSSSSEVDDLDAVPAGTYCVWTPKPVEASPSRCKKSNSTGSSSTSPSKRWKLLDFLRRSNSDGKDTFVFLTPSNSTTKKKKKKEEANNSNDKHAAGKKVAGGEKKVVSAHEAMYVRKREMMRVDKRRSYLPYKQDLVGFCATLNGIPRAFPPF